MTEHARCDAVVRMTGRELRCDDDAGHSGLHHQHDGPFTVSWSDALGDLTGQTARVVVPPES